MGHTDEPFFLGVFFFTFFLAMLHLVNSYRFMRYMEKNHPELCDEYNLSNLLPRSKKDWSGGPGGLHFDNRRGTFGFLKFLITGRYKKTGDKKLISKCRFIIFIMVVFLFNFSYIVYSILDDSKWNLVTKVDSNTAAQSDIINAKSNPNKKAFALYHKKNWQGAIAAFDTIIDDGEADEETTYWRAMAYWQLGNLDEAAAGFVDAMEYDPENYELYDYADRTLSKLNRWDEIIELWGRYISFVPDDSNGYYQRAGAIKRTGDMEAAIDDLGSACDLGNTEACRILKRYQ